MFGTLVDIPPVGEVPIGVGNDIMEWLDDNGDLRCSLKQSLHMNSLHSKQRIEALTSHQLQLILELFDDSGDILGALMPLPIGATPILNSCGVSNDERKLLKKKSLRGGESLRTSLFIIPLPMSQAGNESNIPANSRSAEVAPLLGLPFGAPLLLVADAICADNDELLDNSSIIK